MAALQLLSKMLSPLNSISEFGIFDFKPNVINSDKFNASCAIFKIELRFVQIQLSLLVDV